MKFYILIISAFFFASCSSTKESINVEQKKADNDEVIINFKTGPPTIIYKTKKDYSSFVPVILSEDKSEIVSYPGIKDVYYKGEFAYPTKLHNGYLLDNRGIGANVAFLNITYEDYSKLEKTPSRDKLFQMIQDNNPLTEIYNCGNRAAFKNEIADLNKLIDNNGLEKCKCLDKE